MVIKILEGVKEITSWYNHHGENEIPLPNDMVFVEGSFYNVVRRIFTVKAVVLEVEHVTAITELDKELTELLNSFLSL